MLEAVLFFASSAVVVIIITQLVLVGGMNLNGEQADDAWVPSAFLSIS